MSSSRELVVSDGAGRQRQGEGSALVYKSEKEEHRLARNLQEIRTQIGELVISMRTDPNKQEHNNKQMQVLLGQLKEIEAQQIKLKQDVDQQHQELEDIRAKHLKNFKKEKPKEAAPVLMEELRAMGQIHMAPEDLAARHAEAQKPKPFVASGGLTGFRVADDLFKMDFKYEEDPDPQAWRVQKPKK